MRHNGATTIPAFKQVASVTNLTIDLRWLTASLPEVPEPHVCDAQTLLRGGQQQAVVFVLGGWSKERLYANNDRPPSLKRRVHRLS